jgi:hypothetical protein
MFTSQLTSLRREGKNVTVRAALIAIGMQLEFELQKCFQELAQKIENLRLIFQKL